jgi:hypothetical protein
MTRIAHPALQVVAKAEEAWSRKKQAGIRAVIVVRALIDAGIIRDGEVWHGELVTKEPRP